MLIVLLGGGAITTQGQVVVAFEADDVIVCPGVPVEFTSTSTYPAGSTVSYLWEFPSGFASSLTEAAPTVFYYTPGTYNVTLHLTVDGVTYTLTQPAYITVVTPSDASFTFVTSDICNPLEVTFTSTSTGGSSAVTEYLWDFGDGSFSSLEAPVHTFSSAGTYTVLLFITDENDCTDSYSTTVTVTTPMSSYITDTDGASSCGSSISLILASTTTGGTAPYTYFWDYGNGVTSTAASGLASYSACGTYEVTYTVTDANGCEITNTYPEYIDINCYEADFSMSDDSICEGGSVSFTNLSDPGASSFYWQFNFPASGASVTSTAENPSFTYSVAGSKTIKLTVTYPDGCTAIHFDTVYVSAGPDIAGIAATDSTACDVPFSTFIWPVDVEGAGPFTYAWDIEGDMYSDSLINPTFNTIENFDVDITITDALGCSSSFSFNSFIQIKKPTASFTADPPEGCAPLTVTFTNLSTSLVVPLAYFVWDFDDGTTDTTYTLDPFEHIFTESGNYNVELTVYTEDGCPKSTSLWIQVGDPVAYFEFTDPSSPICNPVGLDNLSEGSEFTTVSWGDGATSTLTPPESDTTHIYLNTDTATYIVTLTAENNGCISTWTDTVTVLPILPLFSIAWNCDNPNLGIISLDSALFTGHDFCWDVAGSGDTLCDLLDITWEFDGPGTYLIQIITDDTISDDDCFTIPPFYFTVPENVASFSMSDNPLCAAGSVVLTSTSSITYPGDYNWEVGPGLYYGDSDSYGPDLASVTFEITTPDIYPITLTTIDANGCIATVTDTLVYSDVTALFGIDSIVGCETRTLWLEDLSTVIDPVGGFITIEEYEWNFDDEDACPTYYGITPPPCTLDAGVYNISLTVTDNFGCSDTYTLNLDLTSTITASFTSDSLSCSSADSLIYVNTSTGSISETFWDFGDGATSTAYDGVHLYATAGVYTVSLTVSDSLGCSNTFTEDINVIFSDLNADFELDYIIGASCPPLPISLTNTSTGDISDFEWVIERESGYFTYFTDEVVLTYTEPGDYDVALYIYNSVGCVDSLNIINAINVPGPTGSLSFLADTVCTPALINFSVIDLDADLAYVDFGDGDTTLITGDFSYSYLEEGVYCPTIILIDSTGCFYAEACDSSLVVYEPHILDFEVVDSTYCLGDSMLFVNNSTGSVLNPILEYTIDYGDGTPAFSIVAFDSLYHVYSTPGLYTVTISSTSSVGCPAAFTYDIDIPETPMVDISYTPASGCFELEVAIELAGLTTGFGIIDYGDGIIDTVYGDTSHIYTEPGTYFPFITLVNGGCSVDYLGPEPVNVYYPSYAGLEFIDSIACSGEEITVYNTSWDTILNPIISYTIDIGDGTPLTTLSSFDSLVFTYGTFGTYPVTLIIENAEGCTDSVTLNAYADALPTGSVAFSPTSACGELDVSISLLDVLADSIIIDFGDGTTGLITSDTNYIYTTPGIYTPEITLTNFSGCSIDFTGSTLELFDLPLADLAISDTLVCDGTPITLFNNTADTGYAAITGYELDMGDGTVYSFSSFTEQEHLYTSTGIFTITSIVTNAGSCSDTMTFNVNVAPVPSGTIEPFPLSACGVLDVNFPIGALAADSIVIDYGDGYIVHTTADTNYIYTTPGIYEPVIYLYNTTGCAATIEAGELVVYEPHILDFEVVDSTYCLGDSMLFVNNSTGSVLNPILEYTIDYGDGTPAFSIVAFDSLYHVYSTPGLYTVTISSTSSVGCPAAFTYDIDIPETPMVDISYTPASGCFELEVAIELAGLTTGFGIIDYGDGIIDTVYGDTSHIYTEPGTYFPFITLVNGGCSVDYLGPEPVNVYYPSYAGLEFIDSIACSGEEITVYNTSWDTILNPIISYTIDIGDGTPLTTLSSFDSLVFTYGTFGTYPVTLIIENAEGCTDSVTLNAYADALPTGSVAFSPTSACGELDVSISLLDVLADSIIIDFGDGTTGLITSDTNYIYTTPGIYTPEITLTNFSGCSIDFTGSTLELFDLPLADLAISDTLVCDGTPITLFNNTADTGYAAITGYELDMGDGTVYSFSSFTEQEHLYTSTGIFTITSIVTNAGSCSDTMTFNVNVAPVPSGTIEPFPLSACGVLDVNFPIGALAADSIVIDYGDGYIVHTTADTNYIYTTPGIYEPVIYLYITTGCAATIEAGELELFDIPVADYSISDTLICSDEAITFFNATADTLYASIDEYHYDFGDGTTSLLTTADDVTHTYTAPGIYEIAIVVINAGGCSDSAFFSIEVLGAPSASMNITPIDGCGSLETTFSFSSFSADSASLFDGINTVVVDGSDYTVLFDTPGVYEPVLTLFNAAGCSTTVLPLEPITVANIPVALMEMPEPGPYCTGQEIAVVNLSVDPEPNPAINAIDQIDLWLSGSSIFSGSWMNDTMLTFSTPGDYSLLMVTANDNGCIDSTSMEFTVYGTPEANAGDDLVICPGTFAELDGSESTGGLYYNWSPSGLFANPTAEEPEALFSSTTWIVLEYATDFCADIDSVLVTVVDDLNLVAGPDTAICTRSAVQLFTTYDNINDDVDIIWLTGDYLNSTIIDNPIATPPNTITYTASATCGTLTVYDDVTIEVYGLPGVEIEGVANFQLNDPELFLADVSPATGSFDYYWEPSEYFACPTCAISMFNPYSSTTVSVTVVDENGCRATDSLDVTVYPACDGDGITVANVITPNNDGYNDVFSLYSEYLDELFYIRIFDRWGNQIYETGDINAGWDGTYNGVPVYAGVYIYSLKGICTGGDEFVKTGNVTILR